MFFGYLLYFLQVSYYEDIFKIEKIYEDDDLLVLNKPFGLVVNRSNTTKSRTLQDILEEEYRVFDYSSQLPVETDFEVEYSSRSGIVHRLDKDTSGVIVVAKDYDTFLDLQKQFKSREIKKNYLALVFGYPQQYLFEVNAPISRNPMNRLTYAIVKDGKEALTRFEVISVHAFEEYNLALLNVMPLTGRTHQIRVHLKALNMPIVGDVLYSTAKQINFARVHFGRMMLHAHKIMLKHPKLRKDMIFEAALPKMFDSFLLGN